MGVGPTMLAGLALVALSEVVMLRIASDADVLAREDLAFALSVVLLSLLMMVVRHNAVSMVVGFMSVENGLILTERGAKGMPLVVEVSVAFSVLVALVVIGVFLFRISERFKSIDAGALDSFQGRPMSFAQELTVVCSALPLITAAVLAVLPSYRPVRAALNMAAAFARVRRLRFAVRLGAATQRLHPHRRPQRRLHCAQHLRRLHRERVQRATYIAHEIETGRLTPTHLRFYHAMYQFLLFSMNLALIANNIGLMWVAIEMATLTTVLMVGIYRTQAAIEAAWKYFILGSVGIALALFGTVAISVRFSRSIATRSAPRNS